MKNKLIAFSALLSLLFTNSCLASEKYINEKNLEISKSIYSKIDSINIEYWIPSQGHGYLFTLKEMQLNIRKINSNVQTEVYNKDSILKINNLVESLFISGEEKTEIGRTYKTSLEFREEPIIIISIFEKDKTIIEHKIYISIETCKIEFSSTFKNFYNFLDALKETVAPKK